MTRSAFEQEDLTSSTGVAPLRTPTETMASLTKEWSLLRDRTRSLDADVGDNHRAAQRTTLELLARERVRSDLRELLNELATDRGLAWSDIARFVGVSVAALRKWRQGEPATPAHRLAIAKLAAFMEMLANVPVVDTSGWLELPVAEGFAPTHGDIYMRGRAELLLELATLRVAPGEALKEVDPAWQENQQLEHEVFEAEDGQLSIRRRR